MNTLRNFARTHAGALHFGWYGWLSYHRRRHHMATEFRGKFNFIIYDK